jgi:hypothetical protein
VILLYSGEGYPASYLYLERKAKEGERKLAITEWYILIANARFLNLKNNGVEPIFNGPGVQI